MYLHEAWTSQIAPEPHLIRLAYLIWGDRHLVPISDPRAGSLFLGIPWVSLPFREVHPIYSTQRQHKRLSCCLANGVRVTASSPRGAPDGSPETGHEPQHMGCFQGKQNLTPSKIFSHSLQGTKFLYSILLHVTVLCSWDLYPFTVSYKISTLSHILLPQSRVFPCVYQPGSSLLVACSNKCIWPFPASLSVLVTATMVWIKMPIPSFIALEGRKIFLKATVSQWIGFFSSPRRVWRRGWVQPSHVEHLLFLLVAMVTEPLAGLAPRGAQWHPVPGQQERGLGRERGSILILMFNGHCFLLVNFQKIRQKATTSASVRLNHCSPITQFWGLQILQYRLPTTYSETVIGIHRIRINVSGLLCLKLVLFVIWVPCSNKQHEFHHLQVFNPISVMVSKSCCTGMSQKKNCLQLQELAGKWALSK